MIDQYSGPAVGGVGAALWKAPQPAQHIGMLLVYYLHRYCYIIVMSISISYTSLETQQVWQGIIYGGDWDDLDPSANGGGWADSDLYPPANQGQGTCPREGFIVS